MRPLSSPTRILTTLPQSLTGSSSSSTPPSTTSGLVEVDLISPHNTTYAPTPVFPLIFAFQNPALAPLLDFHIEYTISSWRDADNWRDANTTSHSSFHVRWANWTSGDPYYEYTPSFKFDEEGTWNLDWTVRWSTCVEGAGELSANTSRHSIFFSIENGAEAVNLVAATRNMCEGDAGLALNVTDVHAAPQGLGWAYEGKCAEVARTLPSPTSCRIEIDDVAVESIGASITDGLCRRSWGPQRWGPPEGVKCPEEESGAQRMIVAGVTCLMALVGSLVHVLVW